MNLKLKSTFSDREFDEVVTYKPNDTESYYNSGIANYKKREYDKAIADFSEVIKREPNHVDAYYNRGNVY